MGRPTKREVDDTGGQRCCAGVDDGESNIAEAGGRSRGRRQRRGSQRHSAGCAVRRMTSVAGEEEAAAGSARSRERWGANDARRQGTTAMGSAHGGASGRWGPTAGNEGTSG